MIESDRRGDGMIRRRIARGFCACLFIAIAASMPACESTQKETITAAPNTKSTDARTGQSIRATPKPNQPSKPITGTKGGSDTKSAAGGRDTKVAATTKASKPQPGAKASAGSGAAPSAATPKQPEPVKPGSASKSEAAAAKSGAAPAGAKQPALVAAPTYAEIAREFNARAARLKRVTAYAVVSVEYNDEEGNRKWEQGEGRFQVIQPSRLALDVRKVSEPIIWIGSDDERYWFIDPRESRQAWIGRHAQVTRDKIESLGMPAAPRDLIALTGMTPLPKPASNAKKDPAVTWSADKKSLSFDVARLGSTWRYTVSARNYEPSRIEVIDSASGESILSATLENYGNVSIKGEGGVPPRLATRIRCLHHTSGSMLGLTLSEMADSGKNKLRDEAFNFEIIKESFGVREVVDLDAPRPAAARAAPAESDSR